MTQWFVLDRGIPPSVFEDTFRDALARLAEPVEGERTSGIIWYGTIAQVMGPVAAADEFASLLDKYWTLPAETSCLTVALQALRTLNTANTSAPERAARRVVLITGAERSLSPDCTPSLDLIAGLGTPVDLIVIDGEIDDVYRDLVEGTGGQLLRAESTSAVARLNELGTAWQRPIFALTGSAQELPTTGQGEVTVTLSRGATVTLPVIVQLPAALQLPPTEVPPTEVPATATATATPPPTDAPATATEPATSTVMPSPTRVPDASVEGFGGQTEPDSPESGGDGDNVALPLLGVLLLLVVVIIGGVIFASRRRNNRLIERSQVIERFEETFIDAEYQRQRGESLPPPALSPVPPPPSARSTDVDDLLLTEMAEDTEQPAPHLGWLRPAKDPDAVAIRLPAGGVLIGRHPTSDIVIESDRLISGSHALISQREDGSVWVTVLSQTNPVAVNRVAITSGQSVQLKTGDIVYLSSATAFEFLSRTTKISEEIIPPCTL